MGIETALIGSALIGGATSLFGASETASAQDNAAQAQIQSTREQIAFEREAMGQQLQQRQLALADAKKYGAQSPAELASVGRILETKSAALNSTLASIQKQQSQLDALDPNVKASGQNLLDLLNGKASQMLAPVQAQMDKQRAELKNQLAGQLGPGFMTSSAGIEALTKFDQGAALSMSQIQSQALSQAGSIFSGLSGQQMQGQNAITSQTSDAFGRAMLADQSVLQADQTATGRTLGAVMSAYGAPVNFEGVAQAQGNMTGVVGNQFQGAATIGNNITQIGQGVASLGGQIAGMNAFKDLYKAGNPSAGGSALMAGQPTNSTFSTGKVLAA